MDRLRDSAAWVINTWWKFSVKWDKKDRERGCSWEEVALDDCKRRIYDVENELADLKNMEKKLEETINKYKS
jgi:hypothetical protein